MTRVVVVEPNELLRLGILQTLQNMAFDFEASGMDYADLLGDPSDLQKTDLMLLSVPDAYPRMVELVEAAQTACEPQRILLMSNAPAIPLAAGHLPSALAGYISVDSSPEVLAAAITLVLAGGKCFPYPDGRPPGTEWVSAGLKAGETPRRRWYDKAQPGAVVTDSHGSKPVNLLRTAAATSAAAESNGRGAKGQAGGDRGNVPVDIAASEAELLALTPRQYEVLALLARGYPVKTISTKLNVSSATVKAHTETLYRRLSVHNRYAAVYAAFSRGATLGMHGR